MTAAPATVGFSPWELYADCLCGAKAGEPCKTGSTGAARLVVHHSRRPVDDTTGAGFVPVLTRDERLLLARVHRWAREKLHTSPYSSRPRWEPEWTIGGHGGAWRRTTTEAHPEVCTVWWGPGNGDEVRVQMRASRYGEELLDVSFRPRCVREAVDVLVALGVLPQHLSSAYLTGYIAGLRRKGTGAAGGLTAGSGQLGGAA
ncbi:hypothetical protein [Dactylosporangium sp. NPDC000521]|uniref:zinc finger domain-containing protein n=1 Tax=Dactylosporangium sp. NPDC000521 TaxID=3363975 RepID=UPI0036B0B9FD